MNNSTPGDYIGYGIAVAIAGCVIAGHIYWTSSGTIARANLDGTGVNQNFIAGAFDPRGVAVG
jgi:hypothetical protein